MKNTKTLLGDAARTAVHDGVVSIYDPVRRTLGPNAKTALLYRTYNRGSRITDDGVTVAEVQEPQNPFVNLVANAFKEMCRRTVEKVGDGTTTTAAVGGKLYLDVYPSLLEGNNSFSAKKSSVSAVDMRNAILASAEAVKKEILERHKKTVDDLTTLEQIAAVSAKDVEIGKVVAGMAWEVGVDGYIDVVEGYKGEIETEVLKGMRFPAKVGAKAFVNNPKRYEMVALDCPVLLTNYALDNAGTIAPLLSGLNTTEITKIIVIAPSFSDNVLVNMATATKQGYFIYPVAVPGLRTEQFEDLAVYCGATFVDKNKDMKLQKVKQDDLGFLDKLIVKDADAREEAVALGGAGTKDTYASKTIEGERRTVLTTQVAERIETLKAQMEEQKDEKFKKIIERRIASMASAVGTIRVGDSTSASSLFRKLKIEDCVYACKAALRGGYVKGGGLCLKEIAEDILPADDLLRPALIHPYDLIQQSVPGGVVIPDDIIDPAEAIYWAVEHATQIVAQLITVEVITVEVDPMDPGDATLVMARVLGEVVISVKKYLGQLQENQEEAERDRLKGLTYQEKIMLDNG